MNDQMATPTPAAIMNGAPGWLTLPFVLIAIGIAFALIVLFWGARLARRRQNVRDTLEDRGEAHFAGTPAPVAPAPPPIAEAPTPATAPSPIADEPIAAAAPLDASPASIAADLAAPVPEPIAEEAPAPELQPTLPAETPDALTRMKGVGPRVADRLHALGITRFSQIAALSPTEAEALDAQLENFKGRLHRDRWVEQAGFLARGDTDGYEAVFGKL
ncbi:hypothetical protein AB2M62_19710 [Sphingomonas sp. MMS12-HWE2-04]|uniref:hypothetical protein n=1 Tax=Sphingomonas sp. MMS12-HWE2-04 TaxID=3234199 RepID=UPI00384F7815